MALSLPYPGLVFVPLDTLTAEEQNEIVANYTYIANQFPIGHSNIGTGAVQSDNIDWTTINASYRSGFNFTSAPVTWSDLSVSGTLPKGKYLCISSGTIGGVSSSREIHIRFHTSEGTTSTEEIINPTQSPYWLNYCCADILELNNAGTISFQSQSSTSISGLQTFGCKMFVIKIS